MNTFILLTAVMQVVALISVIGFAIYLGVTTLRQKIASAKADRVYNQAQATRYAANTEKLSGVYLKELGVHGLPWQVETRPGYRLYTLGAAQILLVFGFTGSINYFRANGLDTLTA